MVSRHKREIRLKNQKVERERTLSTQSAEAVESASSVPTKDNEEASGATPVQEPTEDDKVIYLSCAQSPLAGLLFVHIAAVLQLSSIAVMQ